MARSLQQPDSEVDWDFSERCMTIVRSVAKEAEFKNNTGLIDAQDVEQELLLWLALRKEARDKWESGHEGTLYRNISREAQNIANKANDTRAREVLADESYWSHGESGSEEEWG